MTQEDIKKLLDRYFEGETSLGEERVLKNYFAQDDVPETLRPYAALFGFLKAEKAIKMQAKPRKNLPKYWLMAASILFCLSIGSYFFQQNRAEKARFAQLERYEQDTFEDPVRAQAEIKAALALVSKKMRKSRRVAKTGIEKTRILGKIFKKR